MQDSQKDGSVIQNYVLVVGKKNAKKHFYLFLDSFKNKIYELELNSPLIDSITEYLSQKVEKY